MLHFTCHTDQAFAWWPSYPTGGGGGGVAFCHFWVGMFGPLLKVSFFLTRKVFQILGGWVSEITPPPPPVGKQRPDIDPVRLTEHLRGTRKSEEKPFIRRNCTQFQEE